MRQLAVLLALPFLGCQNYTFKQVCPESVKESSVTVPAATPTPADILFVVDNSGSMADEQENLAVNFDRFINQIAGAGDYQIGVVSTDQVNQIEREGLAGQSYASEYPFRWLGSDISGCVATNPPITRGCFRGPNANTRIVSSATMDRDTQISAFGQNVRVGSCGSGSETGLDAMISALEQANGCNAGFIRDGANLVVIFVSDEQDAGDTPIQQYVNDLKEIKSPSQIRIAAIVGSVDGVAEDCSISAGADCGRMFCSDRPPDGSLQSCAASSECPAGEECLGATQTMRGECNDPNLALFDAGCEWCSYYNTPDCCSAIGGGRYISFARAMEQEITNANQLIPVSNCMAPEGERIACLVDTICQDNFGDTLARIARDLVLTNEYNLDPPAAYPPGVAVRVKNGRFPAEGVDLVYGTDFTVSDDGAVLTIQGEKTPVEGEDIEINFVVEKENRVEQPRGACVVSGG